MRLRMWHCMVAETVEMDHSVTGLSGPEDCWWGNETRGYNNNKHGRPKTATTTTFGIRIERRAMVYNNGQAMVAVLLSNIAIVY